MRFKFSIVLAFLVLFASCKKQEQKVLSLVPVPVEVKTGEGTCLLGPGTILSCADTSILPESRYLADRLKAEYQLGLVLNGKSDSASPVTIIELSVDSTVTKHEGYKLEITRGKVILKGADASGVFYGIQTLFELLPVTGGNLSLPVVSILDYPRFSWRGLHLDVCRHFYGVDYIKRYIDLMARHKLNVFHWHLTEDQGWRIEIKKYPKLTEVGAWRADREDQPWNDRTPLKPGEKPTYGGFYTQDQVREVVAYARKLHVTIVPEIEMPAHAMAALAAYPELSCDGKDVPVAPGGVWPITRIYCAGNEKTFQMLEDVLLEVMDLFPSTFIHIGGDEATKDEWVKCPKCQKRMKSEKLASVEELQSYFIKRIEKFLNDHHRRLIGWDEILEGGLPAEATVMSWRGISGGIAAAQQDHDVVMSPSTYMYFDYYQGRVGEPLAIGGYLPLDSVYSFDPVPTQLDPSKQKYILGVQANVWTEYIPTESHLEYMVYPRACALSEVAWSPREKKNYVDFMARMGGHYDLMDLWKVHYRQPDIDGVPNDTLKIDPGYKATLICPRPEWEIRYTTDGSEPTMGSKLYSKPVTIKGAYTLKARPFKSGEAVGRMGYRAYRVE